MLRQFPPFAKFSKICLLAGLFALVFEPSAHAVLGESESTVPALAKNWKSAAMTSLTTLNYHVLEVDDGGVSVREYVGPDGKVFAVTWRGMRQPNLPKLLGNYHGELQAAEKQRPARRSLREPLQLKTLNTTSYRGGHMRDIRGRVFLTDHLPDGVRPEDLE